MRPHVPTTFVIGGKFGDCCQMIGAFHEIFQRTGQKPNVITSHEFATIYEGCSFVNAVPFRGHWYGDLQKMKAYAVSVFGGGENLQTWNDLTSPEFTSARFPGGIILQSHGRDFGVDISKDPHYGASMMRRAGFSWEEALKLRPVFDRRNAERELQLVDRLYPRRTKPLLLLAYDGQSSPWGHQPEAYQILSPLYRCFHVVDLGKLKCHRVYDMLGLMERAVGLLTIDTLALHMASAANLPYAAFTQNGWTGSIPKGNCVLEIKYSQSLQRMREILPLLEQWKSNGPDPPDQPIRAARPGHRPPSPGSGGVLAQAALARTSGR